MNPDSEMLFVLAHEIGHAIGPCQLQMPFYEIDEGKLKNFLNDPNLPPGLKKSLSKKVSSGTQRFSGDLALKLDDLSWVDRLIKKGVFREIQKGSAFAAYPFKKEYQCFTNNHFNETQEEDLTYTRKKLKQAILQSSEDERQVARKTVKRYLKALDQYPQCMRTFGPASKMEEVMSDMFGALVEEKYLSSHPPTNEAEKIAAIWNIEDSCIDRKKLPRDSFSPNTVEEVIKMANQDVHPDNSPRVDKIILSLPGMAKLFDCQPKVTCFDHLSLLKNTNQTGAAAENLDPQSQGGSQ